LIDDDDDDDGNRDELLSGVRIPALLPAWLSVHVVTYIDQVILYVEPGLDTWTHRDYAPEVNMVTKFARLHFNLRQTIRECVYFRSRDKDGGDIIRSAITENPMLHANFTALFSIEPELLPT